MSALRDTASTSTWEYPARGEGAPIWPLAPTLYFLWAAAVPRKMVRGIPCPPQKFFHLEDISAFAWGSAANSGLRRAKHVGQTGWSESQWRLQRGWMGLLPIGLGGDPLVAFVVVRGGVFPDPDFPDFLWGEAGESGEEAGEAGEAGEARGEAGGEAGEPISSSSSSAAAAAAAGAEKVTLFLLTVLSLPLDPGTGGGPAGFFGARGHIGGPGPGLPLGDLPFGEVGMVDLAFSRSLGGCPPFPVATGLDAGWLSASAGGALGRALGSLPVALRAGMRGPQGMRCPHMFGTREVRKEKIESRSRLYTERDQRIMQMWGGSGDINSHTNIGCWVLGIHLTQTKNSNKYTTQQMSMCALDTP